MRRWHTRYGFASRLGAFIIMRALIKEWEKPEDQQRYETYMLFRLFVRTILYVVPFIVSVNAYVDHDINLWCITIPFTVFIHYVIKNKDKKEAAIQAKYDDVAFMINRNNTRYDQAKTTSEYKEVYETYVQAINIIEEQMMVEYYDVRDKIKAELPNIERKIRG